MPKRAAKTPRLAALALLCLVAIFSGVTPSRAQSPPAGAIVALAGTPHLWVSGEDGLFHWVGDTRALGKQSVDWGNRREVSLVELRTLARGEPWLSAGIVETIGRDTLHWLVKWETDWEDPQLLLIDSAGDSELFGITDQAILRKLAVPFSAWERQFNKQVVQLQRGKVTSPAMQLVAPLAPPVIGPLGPRLSVASKTLAYYPGFQDHPVPRISIQIRNDGDTRACGATVSISLVTASGAVRDTQTIPHSFEIPPGGSVPFTYSWNGAPEHAEVRVAVTPGSGSCSRFWRALATSGVQLTGGADPPRPPVSSVTGPLVNDTAAPFHVIVLVAFYGADGALIDTWTDYGPDFTWSSPLLPGRPRMFTGRTSASGISEARAFAFRSTSCCQATFSR
jgi:hypothetical protein